VSNGLTRSLVNALAVDPTSASTLYAATGWGLKDEELGGAESREAALL